MRALPSIPRFGTAGNFLGPDWLGRGRSPRPVASKVVGEARAYTTLTVTYSAS